MSRNCKRCGIEKPLSDFYKNGTGSNFYCKICSGDQAKERQRALKEFIVSIMGGCCSVCGYKNYIGALDFHHKDPKEKEFEFRKLGFTNFKRPENRKILDDELAKCVLLCKNCHREEHERWNNDK
jgi:5-methylcytosine-specific restriction endonuclease McrA